MSAIIPSPYSIAKNHISLPVSHSTTFSGVWARESDNILQQSAGEGVKTRNGLVAWADQEEEIYDDYDYAHTPTVVYELYFRGEWHECPCVIPPHVVPTEWRRTYPCQLHCHRLWFVQNCQILPLQGYDNEFYFDFSKATSLWLAPFAGVEPDRALEYTRPYSTPYGDISGFTFDSVPADWGHVFRNIAKPKGHLRQQIANELIESGEIPEAWNLDNPFLVCGVKFKQPTEWITRPNGSRRKVPKEDPDADYEYVTTHAPDTYIYWNEPASPAENWGDVLTNTYKGAYLYDQLSHNLGRPLIKEFGVGKAFDFQALVSNYYKHTAEKMYGEQGFDPTTKTVEFRANRFEFSFRQLKQLPPL